MRQVSEINASNIRACTASSGKRLRTTYWTGGTFVLLYIYMYMYTYTTYMVVDRNSFLRKRHSLQKVVFTFANLSRTPRFTLELLSQTRKIELKQ